MKHITAKVILRLEVYCPDSTTAADVIEAVQGVDYEGASKASYHNVASCDISSVELNQKGPVIPIQIENCQQCDCWHRHGYTGDCRNNAERFADLEDAANRLNSAVTEIFPDGSTCDVMVFPEG